jgi:hypothetical protein
MDMTIARSIQDPLTAANNWLAQADRHAEAGEWEQQTAAATQATGHATTAAAEMAQATGHALRRRQRECPICKGSPLSRQTGADGDTTWVACPNPVHGA